MNKLISLVLVSFLVFSRVSGLPCGDEEGSILASSPIDEVEDNVRLTNININLDGYGKFPLATQRSIESVNIDISLSTSASDIDQYLQAHNSVRQHHGASDLTWNNNLASKAQQWANGCVFKHSGGKLGPYGENLAAGTGGAYGIAAAIKSWTDEVSEYNPHNPQPSHFTQVVWKNTKQVGCALKVCPPGSIFPSQYGPSKYYVCEYSPPGNVIGQFPQNVQV
ncbi:hypothetical protein JAAARDRAFT_76028 [Jaapia argillacea MUCL 33604]|uniref:SCP domain-containing protein n=1 Tax=Jaapia argillacea MUCL 33604 TaxID=933084 RepID=A0A067QCC7_9AGAM|nr:hypothetical protein JAAARDRAFT_76028 [Jaapia argillacea MUCL 33604]